MISIKNFYIIFILLIVWNSSFAKDKTLKINKVKVLKVSSQSLHDNLKYPINISYLGGPEGTVITSEVAGEVVKIEKRYGEYTSKNENIIHIKGKDYSYNAIYRSKSPLKGQIYKVFVTIGEFVGKGSKLFSVVAPHQIELSVEAISSNITKIPINLEGELKLHDSNKSLKIKVGRIVPFIDPLTGTFKVVLNVEDQDKNLLIPGIDGVVSFKINHRKGLLVPSTGLRYDGKKYYYPTVKNKKINIATVKIGQRRDDQIEITSGLNEDDLVVPKSKNYLNGGDQVEIEEEG